MTDNQLETDRLKVIVHLMERFIDMNGLNKDWDDYLTQYIKQMEMKLRYH